MVNGINLKKKSKMTAYVWAMSPYVEELVEELVEDVEELVVTEDGNDSGAEEDAE